MEQFNYQFNEEYSHSVEFKTNVVKRFDGSEQRQAQWMCPKRTFSLNFEANKLIKTSLEQFYQQQKGDCHSFFWRWESSYFGNNIDYICFLDSSKFSQAVFAFSYAKIPLMLSTIDDGNILRGRFFLDENFWSFQGNIIFSPENASYQGESSLFQAGVLTPGHLYRLKVKNKDVQGFAPVLSLQTAILDEFERSFLGGDKTIEFVALGADLIFEMQENSSGAFCEIALFDLSNDQSVFDFQPNVEYQNELSFSNLKDEIFTFKNARQNLVETPARRWILTLELTPCQANIFEAFFISKKGRYKAFEWVFEGENLQVRFDTDKLEQKQYQLGYREIKTPIIEVL